MGNCQATDMAAIIVDYPGGRVEKFFLAVPARQLMLKNPGYFVAITAVGHRQPTPSTKPVFKRVRCQPASYTEPAKPIFKLLPGDAPLCVGNRYRLVSFEEVFTYFSQGGIDSVVLREVDPQRLQAAARASSNEVRNKLIKQTKGRNVVEIGCSHRITKLRF